MALGKVDRPANGSRKVCTRTELNRTEERDWRSAWSSTRGRSCVFKGDREDESVLDKGKENEEKVIELWVSKQLAYLFMAPEFEV